MTEKRPFRVRDKIQQAVETLEVLGVMGAIGFVAFMVFEANPGLAKLILFGIQPK